MKVWSTAERLSRSIPSGLWELQTGTVWWCDLSQRSKRKTTKNTEETDLAEKLWSDETVRFPCGGRDEAYTECELLVWKRRWGSSGKGILLEVWRWTRAVDQKKVVCISSRRRRWMHAYELMDAQRKLVSTSSWILRKLMRTSWWILRKLMRTSWRILRKLMRTRWRGQRWNWCVQADEFSENWWVRGDGCTEEEDCFVQADGSTENSRVRDDECTKVMSTKWRVHGRRKLMRTRWILWFGECLWMQQWNKRYSLEIITWTIAIPSQLQKTSQWNKCVTYQQDWCPNKMRSQDWQQLVGRIIHGNICH